MKAITIRLDSELYARIEKQAAAESRSVPNLIRLVMGRYLEQVPQQKTRKQ
jgi:predicted transcriptional regulator